MGRLDIFKQEMGLSDRTVRIREEHPSSSFSCEEAPAHIPESEEGLPWVTHPERYGDDPSGLSY